MKKALRGRILTTFKAVLGVSLLVYILYKYVDLETFRGVHLHLGYLLLFIILYLSVLAIAAFRWAFILRRLYDVRIPFRQVLPLTYFGQTMALVSPSRVGDIGRAAFIKNKLPVKRAVLTLLYDKGSELIALVALGAIGTFYLRESLLSLMPRLSMPLLVLAGCIGSIGLLIAWQVGKERFKPLFKKHLPDAGTSAGILVLSTAVMGFTMMLSYFGALVLGLRPPFLGFMAVSIVQALIQLLPISVGGLGVREGTAVVLFPLIGLLPEQGILISWVNTVGITLFPALVGAGLYIALRGTFIPSQPTHLGDNR